MTALANPAFDAFRRRHLMAWPEILPWLIAVAVYFVFPTYLPFGTQVLITVLFALSLDLVLGYAGIVTLGHAAFFGAGAYTVGILSQHAGWSEPLTGLLAAALVAGLLGLASGFVLLRTHGLTLLMLTLSTAAMLEELGNQLSRYTGGFDGMPGLNFGAVFGIFPFDPVYSKMQYWYALIVLFLLFVVSRALVRSPFGQSLTGMRENTLRMHAIGAPVRGRLIQVYTISAAMAGAAGALFAQCFAYVNLATLSLDRSAGVMVMLILGGYGRLYGAFIGVTIYLVLEHYLSKQWPAYWQLGLGLVLIVVALFAQRGALGILDWLGAKLRAGEKPS
jgi:branched-chain amino acid transport system permease protein